MRANGAESRTAPARRDAVAVAGAGMSLPAYAWCVLGVGVLFLGIVTMHLVLDLPWPSEIAKLRHAFTHPAAPPCCVPA